MGATSAIVFTFLLTSTIVQGSPRSVKHPGKHPDNKHEKLRVLNQERATECVDLSADLTASLKRRAKEVEVRVSPSKIRLKEIEKINEAFKKHGQGRINAGGACPVDLSSIAPCNCDDSGVTYVLDCSQVSSFENLKDILNGAEFQDTAFNTFIYAPDPNLATGHGDTFLDFTFGGLSFAYIIIEGTTVETVEDYALTGSETTLTNLILASNNLLLDFPFHQLENYVELNVIDIEHSSLMVIPDLGSLPKLSDFIVRASNVEIVVDMAFAQLPLLANLNLHDNYLVNINTNSFYFSSLATFVHMDSNEILNLPPFPGYQPVALLLSHNNLTTFSQSTYGPVLDRIVECSYSTLVDVTTNPIDCEEMDWVYNDANYRNHILSDCEEYYAPTAKHPNH